MKVERIEVANLKAVDTAELDLNGKTVIVIAGNDKGKSTVLMSLINRFKGEKPDIIVKHGEQKGHYFMTLTDGSRIEWKFTEKTESFAFITPEGFKQTQSVLTGIGERYFGKKFDIDKFIQASPKEQLRITQRLVGIDLSDLDQKYEEYYDKRRQINVELWMLRAKVTEKPKPIEPVDLKVFEEGLKEAKEENERLRKEWKEKNEKHLAEIKAYNAEVEKQQEIYEETIWAFEKLKEVRETKLNAAVDWEKAREIKASVKKGGQKKELTMLPEPEYLDVTQIEAQYSEARQKSLEYERYLMKLKEYNDIVEQGKKKKKDLEDIEQKIADVIAQKKKRLAEANIPDDFTITDDGLLYNGYPLSTNQISSSAKYIAALKLGSMVLGEVKTLHFDAGLLDKENLNKVIEWADKNGLQLLIERPDFEGGEIRYEIV